MGKLQERLWRVEMIIILLESPSNIILPFLDELKGKYPKSCRAVVGPGDRLADLIPKFSKPPLFTSGWLIECSPSVRAATVKKLDETGNNYVVVRVTSSAQKEKVLHEFDGADITFIDNYNLGREEVLAWIVSELGCDDGVAEAIYKRVSGKLNSVVAAVGTLSILGKVTKSDVTKYVRAASNTSVGDIVPFILGCAKHSVTYRSVLDVIQQYQYGISWLVKYLIAQLDEYLAVWEYASLGILKPCNVEAFKAVNKDSRLGKVSSKQIAARLAWFGSISVEFIEYIRQHMALLDTSDRLCVYKLIQLVKLGG